MSTEARLKSVAGNNPKSFLKVWSASGKNLRRIKRKVLPPIKLSNKPLILVKITCMVLCGLNCFSLHALHV